MTNYVLGFMFSQDRQWVALITKRRPTWQAEKLNGIGGKIEDGETAISAMIREFREETGVEHTEWDRAARLDGEFGIVACYTAFTDAVFGVRTATDEPVALFRVEDVLLTGNHVANLPLLMMIALDTSGIQKPVMLRDVSRFQG